MFIIIKMSVSGLRVMCVVAIVLVASCGVQGGLTLNKKCGEKICGEKEFCSPFDNICRPCDSVCELGSHNYQEEMCQKDCQDYLHDRLYVKRNEQTMENLQGDIQSLYVLVTVTLVICVIILVLLVTCFLYVLLRARKNGGLYTEKIRKKLTALQKNNVGNKDVEAEAQKAAYNNKSDNLKLEINPPPPAAHVCRPPATMSTPLSTRPPRHPSEDTTLEYAAYDNPGMTPSPVFEKGEEQLKVAKRESSF